MKTTIHISSGRGPVEVRHFVYLLAQHICRRIEGDGIEVKWTDMPNAPELCRSAQLELEHDHRCLPLWLMAQQGTHALIAKAGGRARHARKRWFAKLAIRENLPTFTPQVAPAEVQVQCVRATGPGGQHVNKSSSAVRMTHLPTGTSVLSRAERSQAMNRKVALKALERRLCEDLLRTSAEEALRLHAEKQVVERGRPVQTYILDTNKELKECTGKAIGSRL